MPEKSARRFETFRDFWRFYVSEHASRLNRRLHVGGTAAALILAVFAMHTAWLWLLVPVVGYGPAWIGHFLVERNRPATFRYPLWSLLADLKMMALTLLGKMGSEIERAKSSPAK